MFLLDKSIIPTSADDLKLIHAGQILGTGKTLAECRVCIVPRAVITMHVVVRPPVARRRAGGMSFPPKFSYAIYCWVKILTQLYRSI